MVPIVARALMLLAVCVVLITVALLLPPGRQAPAGERPVLSFLIIVAALILGIFVLLMLLFAGP
jgi:hypothetical protein